jgi:hypothetical protein
MAQVYSQNVVGYVNVSVPIHAGPQPTYSILANPLNGTNNNIATILPNVPTGAQVFRFNSGTGFTDPETFFGPGLGWDPGTMDLPPGEGFFISLDPASPNPTTITFVGEVPQGTLTTSIEPGYNLKASAVPQEGALTGVLGLTPVAGDQVFLWDTANQRYGDPYTFFPLPDGWDPSDPVVPVGQGFFIFNASGSAYNWSRTFTVQ